mmetsp:Transcript_25316/g.22341  ORF Transcript_25316/g.22341 Transcript_25316/m.22341 type:complete len:112 (+) Transcript_25316:2050-2385(+)
MTKNCSQVWYKRPGPISNKNLIKFNSIINSNEMDLELKENLLEHHDFVAVSNDIYEALFKWYSCDFDIPRVLRPDPAHPGKLHLDLYPGKYKRRTKSKTMKHMKKISNGGM